MKCDRNFCRFDLKAAALHSTQTMVISCCLVRVAEYLSLISCPRRHWMSCRLSVEDSNLTRHNYLNRVVEADIKCQIPKAVAPRKVQWRFTTKDARVKLRRLYPNPAN